jgi:hypothetical protein
MSNNIKVGERLLVDQYCYNQPGNNTLNYKEIAMEVEDRLEMLGNLAQDLKQKEDVVNLPSHYRQGKIEVLDFIQDQNMNFLEGNVIKYTARYKYKNGLQDLLKAEFYLKRLIKEIQEKAK